MGRYFSLLIFSVFPLGQGYANGSYNCETKFSQDHLNLSESFSITAPDSFGKRFFDEFDDFVVFSTGLNLSRTGGVYYGRTWSNWDLERLDIRGNSLSYLSIVHSRLDAETASMSCQTSAQPTSKQLGDYLCTTSSLKRGIAESITISEGAPPQSLPLGGFSDYESSFTCSMLNGIMTCDLKRVHRPGGDIVTGTRISVNAGVWEMFVDAGASNTKDIACEYLGAKGK